MLISNKIENLITAIKASKCSTFIYQDEAESIIDTDILILVFGLNNPNNIEDLKSAFGFLLTMSSHKYSLIKSIFSSLLPEGEISYFMSLISLMNFYNTLIKKSHLDSFTFSKMPNGQEFMIGFSKIRKDGQALKLIIDDLDEYGLEFKSDNFKDLYYNYLQYIRRYIADTIDISIDDLNNDNLDVFRMIMA